MKWVENIRLRDDIDFFSLLHDICSFKKSLNSSLQTNKNIC